MNTNTQRRGVPQGDFLRGTETQRERREKQKSQNEKIFALSAFDLLCVPSASLRLRVSLALGHSGKFLIYAVALGLTLSQPAFAAKAKKPAPPATAEVAEKQSDLKDLRGQIESLRKDMAATEGTRADVVDQLKDSEREISITQRDLHQLGGQRVGLQTTLKDLGAQAHDLENRLNSQQNQLEKLVYRQYLQGNPDALHLLLNGDDPNQLARDLHYLAAIGHARTQLLQEISTTLQRKQTLAADTQTRAEQLAAVEAKQKEQHGKLVAQREQRKATLEKVSAKIAAQRREIGSLQRDEKRLSQLIDRLAKIIAAKPAPRKPAQRGAEAEVRDKTTGKPATEIANERTPEAVPSGNFARLKGSLRLPTKGVVSNRFGATRQEGSAWKGLFIRAATGNEVKAIAGGRVVFADWMRGFGNLLIVDHGDSYLTIYGNNDSLLKQVGDAVRGGDTVASVGNSGGNPESGLYFELRHLGQPLDPLKWVNVK
jgi:septal ring factor EnvC (AmiA/AmiB activator)